MIYRGRKKPGTQQIEWQVFVEGKNLKDKGVNKLLKDILGGQVDIKA